MVHSPSCVDAVHCPPLVFSHWSRCTAALPSLLFSICTQADSPSLSIGSPAKTAGFFPDIRYGFEKSRVFSCNSEGARSSPLLRPLAWFTTRRSFGDIPGSRRMTIFGPAVSLRLVLLFPSPTACPASFLHATCLAPVHAIRPPVFVTRTILAPLGPPPVHKPQGHLLPLKRCDLYRFFLTSPFFLLSAKPDNAF